MRCHPQPHRFYTDRSGVAPPPQGSRQPPAALTSATPSRTRNATAACHNPCRPRCKPRRKRRASRAPPRTSQLSRLLHLPLSDNSQLSNLARGGGFLALRFAPGSHNRWLCDLRSILEIHRAGLPAPTSPAALPIGRPRPPPQGSLHPHQNLVQLAAWPLDLVDFHQTHCSYPGSLCGCAQPLARLCSRRNSPWPLRHRVTPEPDRRAEAIDHYRKPTFNDLCEFVLAGRRNRGSQMPCIVQKASDAGVPLPLFKKKRGGKCPRYLG